MCTWEGHKSPHPKGVSFQAFLRVCARASGCRGRGEETPGRTGRGQGQGLEGTKVESPQKTGNASLSRFPIEAIF